MFHTDPSLLARRSNLAQRGTVKAHWRAQQAARARWRLKHENEASNALQTPGKRSFEANAQDPGAITIENAHADYLAQHNAGEIDQTISDIWFG